MQRTSTDDPLALPQVPPPAPADHPWRDRILAALFALALPAIALVDPLGGKSTVWENRDPVRWPELSPVVGFPTRFEQAFADRFHSRSALLVFQHAVVAGLFRTSPAPSVLIGREGWLYWLGEDGRSLDRNFRGTLTVQDTDLAAVAVELKRRRDFLAARGIPFLVTIVPEKFTIYPEYLPHWVAPGATPTPLARLEALLAADGSVHYVDLVLPLRSAKASALLY